MVASLCVCCILVFNVHGSTYTCTRTHTLAVLSSVNLTLFPVLYFFSFLYYTDVGATLLVLLGYTLRLRGNHLLSALVS